MSQDQLVFPPGYRYNEPHYNRDIQQWVIHHELGVHFGDTADQALQRALAVVDRAQNHK